MESFTDRYGRKILIVCDGSAVTAQVDGKIIGRVDVEDAFDCEEMPDYTQKITGMFVDPTFKGAGIGLELLRVGFESFGPMLPGDLYARSGDTNALTTEGLRLTLRAQKLDYVLPFPSEQNDPDMGADD